MNVIQKNNMPEQKIKWLSTYNDYKNNVPTTVMGKKLIHYYPVYIGDNNKADCQHEMVASKFYNVQNWNLEFLVHIKTAKQIT
jgi:hypothetical protein